MVSRYIIDNEFEKEDTIDAEVMVQVRHIATSVAGHPISDEEAEDFYNTYNIWQGEYYMKLFFNLTLMNVWFYVLVIIILNILFYW